MEESGSITKKDTKSGGAGDKAWTRAAYTVNGKVYSTFDIKLMDFNEGDSIHMDYEKSSDGKYNNIKSMLLMQKGSQQGLSQQPVEVKVEKIDTSNNMWEKKDMRIAKMSAVKESANMLNTIALVTPQYLIKAFEAKDPFEYLKERSKELLDYIYE